MKQLPALIIKDKNINTTNHLIKKKGEKIAKTKPNLNYHTEGIDKEKDN